jgi:hypothetical protein
MKAILILCLLVTGCATGTFQKNGHTYYGVGVMDTGHAYIPELDGRPQ